MELTDDETYYLETFSEKFPHASNALKAFLIYLYRSNMQGHLCVHMNDGSLEPEPFTLEMEDTQLIKKGFIELQSLKEEAKPYLIVKEDDVYFQKNFELELRIMEGMQSIAHSALSDSFDDLEDHKDLSKEQNLFVKRAMNHRLCFLTGGPGTGKTYTVSQFLNVLWGNLSEKEKQTYQIALCAPTGKAAAHLKLSLEKLNLDPELIEKCQAKTLHSFLGLTKQSLYPAYNERRPSPFQLVIVDESSMIDARLMAALVASIRKGAKLILVGDPDQLPPVDTGQVLPDLLALHPQYVSSLSQCFRLESSDLIDFAGHVQEGQSQKAWDLLKEGKESLTLINENIPMRPKELEAFVRNIIFEKQLDQAMDRKNAEHAYRQFRILCPMRKGSTGVESINEAFKRQMPQKGIYLPIIITKNAPSQGLFNGDSGLLFLKSSKLRSSENRAYFSMSDGKTLEMNAPLLPPFDLAFALSIHKSQGSEFDEILALLPEGSEKFGREVLYTAATRAKKKLKIWGHKKTFLETLKRKSRKVSGICRLYSACSS